MAYGRGHHGQNPYVNVTTALNQQSGSTQSQGMQLQPTMNKELTAKFELEKLQAQKVAASSARNTKAPKNLVEVVMKLEANNASPVRPDVAAAASPVVIRAIAKGAKPIKAWRALRTPAAEIITQCTQAVNQLPSHYRAIYEDIKLGLGSDLVEIKLLEQQILALNKEVGLLILKNDPDTLQKAQGALSDAQIAQANIIASSGDRVMAYLESKKGQLDGFDDEILECLLAMARAEGALEFEAMIGSEIKTSEQELAEEEAKSPEEIMAETEGAVILAQAAEEAELPAPTAETPSDVAVSVKSGFEEYLTPKNMLLGGLLLGGLYLLTRD